MPVIAEVSDKMMSWQVLITINVLIILMAALLTVKFKPLIIVPILGASFLALAVIEELNDPHVGPAIINELGYFYPMLSLFPLVAIAILIITPRKYSVHSLIASLTR